MFLYLSGFIRIALENYVDNKVFFGVNGIAQPEVASHSLLRHRLTLFLAFQRNTRSMGKHNIAFSDKLRFAMDESPLRVTGCFRFSDLPESVGMGLGQKASFWSRKRRGGVQARHRNNAMAFLSMQASSTLTNPTGQRRGIDMADFSV